MDIGNPEKLKFNKAFSDVVDSLEALQASLSKAEEDYLPRRSIDLAVGALERFEELAKNSEMSSEFAQKGKVLELVSRLDPAIQTAVGVQHADLLRDHFANVRKVLEKPNLGKVNPTELDPRGQR